MEKWDRIISKMDRLLDKVEGILQTVSPLPDLDPSIFESHIAFRWVKRKDAGSIIPVEHPHLFDLDNLVGVDAARAELIRNSAQFVDGYPANNVLLWGERGTGKSSCVKGLLRIFAPKGLRLIEVQKNDLLSLTSIVRSLRGIPYRFIMFCDDLSFDEGEISYRELKAVLEGGIEQKPENVLLYATSNRRHLMPEPMDDNLGREIHPEEALSEKLSLADRFGLNLSFYAFSQETYLAVVEHYAARMALPIEKDLLRTDALRWALSKGQRSGRSARQFIDDLAGRLKIRGYNDGEGGR
ncbi:MAG: ATP-binding protein [Deltaproteobacteria bacterium]|jgi:predicted AAA+ superfamily ATPase